MKKHSFGDCLLVAGAVCSALLHQGIRWTTGLPLPSALGAFLLLFACLCVQWLFLRLAKRLRYLPLGLALLLFIWGTWLFFASSAWQYAAFGGLILDYGSPLMGTLLGCLIHLLHRWCKKPGA